MNKKVIYLIVAILLLGAGYWYFTQNKSTAPLTNGAVATQTTSTAEPQKPAANTEIQASASSATEIKPFVIPDAVKQMPVVDATWKTYTDKAQTFEFQWPTKGRYAPTWDVKFSDSDCVGEQEGSMQSKKTFEADGVSFCHVSLNEGAAGSFYLTDIYTTKRDNRYVAITFNKKVTSASALNCDFASQYPYSTSASSCVLFDQAAYILHLEQIVGTFRNLK